MGTHAKRKQMTWAYRYSSSRLALNYYAFYESLYEIHRQIRRYWLVMKHSTRFCRDF